MTNSPESHALYQGILKMVLWGEDRADVLDRLRVNGVEGAEAEELYLTAHRERVATFRQEFKKRIALGLILMVGGALLFSVLWFGLLFIPKIVLYACAIAIGMGLWKFTNGLVGFFDCGDQTGIGRRRFLTD